MLSVKREVYVEVFFSSFVVGCLSYDGLRSAVQFVRYIIGVSALLSCLSILGQYLEYQWGFH